MSQPTKRQSHWTSPEGMKYLGPHQSTDPIDITIVLRRCTDTAPPAAFWPHPPRWPRGEFGQHYGAAQADLESLRRFAQQHGLSETGNDVHRRVLHLRGAPAALEKAFGVTLGQYQFSGKPPFVGCGHAPTLPAEAIAVLGLDRRPVAQPRSRLAQAAPNTSYTPLQLGQLYEFPAGTDGTGETIGIIELGGGFTTSDLTQYFSSLGISPQPKVVAVSVAGGQNQPGGSADDEVMLDIEVAGALAPAATIAVYFTTNTDQGFYEAISQAAHDTTNKPSVISISWGGPEENWNSSSLAAMETALQDAAALGVTVTVAAGDNGSSDGVSDNQPHVDFPASSPYSLACGGTTLVASGNTIQSEVVWNETASNEGATGGGVSVEYALPTWQQNAKVPASPSGSSGRGVPDVAGNADPMTGYQVLIGGQSQVIGGTSAVAPLWAALIARFNQKLGAPVGDLHAAIYQIGESAFRDITQGNNGAYQAGPGWDACTGLGSPNGQALLTALVAQKG
ncbi:S53 family peptidase [Dyella mobilis]|uniref:S8 family serine peptidase n=1 Tax=Dyella mobilis TaxID=1849582 RepID=A0ABS2KFY0_9GAMM|nr:S53 family peptidase [Dyella mobilis]MBM7129278.1 S8 family serine peptidase [Dyella mobilis]GLQ98570.1 kumamolisin [Dyella mobilis]